MITELERQQIEAALESRRRAWEIVKTQADFTLAFLALTADATVGADVQALARDTTRAAAQANRQIAIDQLAD
jgi:hypothetical protein